MNQGQRKHPRGPAILLVLLSGCSSPSPLNPQTRPEVALDSRTPQPGQTTASPSTRLRSFAVRTHEPSPAPEAERHRQGCAEGAPAACHAAGLDAYYKPSDPVTDREALHYFKRACDAGYAPSCNGLGVLFAEGRGTAKDPAQAAQLYQTACVAGASTGCEHLAEALSHGRGVTRDATAADRARARAKCVFAASLANGSATSCLPLLPSSSVSPAPRAGR